MKLVVGLGNPGTSYAHTRHNVGFMMVDMLSWQWQASSWKESRHQSLISEVMKEGEKILLVKPMTYMNRSGTSIASLLSYYRLSSRDMIVISDDLDMKFGKIRMRQKGRHGGHNGLRDIIAQTGNADFARIKIGIGRNIQYSVSDWVLSNFTPSEQKVLETEVFPTIDHTIHTWLWL